MPWRGAVSRVRGPFRGDEGPFARKSPWGSGYLPAPALLLDFVGTRAVDSRITFVRATGATYFDANGVLQTAGNNVARIDFDPVTKACLGLLIEEARTNLVSQPCDLTAAGWSASNITAAANQTGPDNAANSASSITATADAGTILFAITSASAARSTTAYVKRITGTGAVQMTQDGGSTWAAVTVTSAWTRVSIASATVTNPSVGFRLATNTDAIAVFGVQCETGAFATSVIPNPAALTRNVDNASMTGTNFSAWYRADEGTFFADYVPTALTYRALSATDGTQNNAISITRTTNTAGGDTYISNAFQGVATGVPVSSSAGQRYRQALAYKLNAGAVASGGALSPVDTSYGIPTVDRMLIGQSRGGTSAMGNGWIRKIAFYATRLNASRLISLTQ